MLSLVKLTNAEYLITSVASGLEDYYMGSGEAPGVWHGRWAAELDLAGVVGHDQLRALVNGHDPASGADLLAGQRARTVNAFDATFSAPKSASLLWAFGPPEVATTVTIAHVEAVSQALDYLEARAAFARRQVDGVRSRVPTHGWAVATFVHRTSRAGDPQLHTHCLIPNLVQRADGSHASFDAGPLHDWAKAAGSIYQEQLRRTLAERLEVDWGPDRHGCREMVGFSAQQLRAFSKRSVDIEAYLEAAGEPYASPAARMRADEAASLDTRDPKDAGFTPELLRQRWAAEAGAVGLEGPEAVAALVVGRRTAPSPLSRDEVFAHLVDPELGLCAHDSRFTEAHVVAAVAAMGAGRLDVAAIDALAGDFLASEHVVRLVPADAAGTRRRPPEWSTASHRALEDRVLAHLATLTGTDSAPMATDAVEAALAAEPRLGPDQADAVRALCGPGPALRSLISPAGFGKTTAVHAAALAAAAAGRPVLGVATTNQAVGELRDVGLEAVTIARLGLDLDDGARLRPGTVVVLDEASQTSTADAEVVLGAVATTPGAQLWALGDVRQAQAVRAGGLAAEIDRLGADGVIPAPALRQNRRQRDPVEREALAAYRAGLVADSQSIRSEAGWEHQLGTPEATRAALAAAAVADADGHGVTAVAVLAASHTDCEDLADRIRAMRIARGELGGDALAGPGWGTEARRYATGDRVLLHARHGSGSDRLHNGTAATVAAVGEAGLDIVADDGRRATVARAFVEGRRRDHTPNLSHAWARTVDGAQGGTWAQVHVLGSAALDNFKGYVAQSRSEWPTHTWNVSRVIDVDYGGILADRPEPAEEVLAALRRAPLKTFAALDDPWATDARLRAELGDHERVVATRPPDRRPELDEATKALARARQELEGAEAFLAGATGRLEATGPLGRMRREGRAAHGRAVADVDRATEARVVAQKRLGAAEGEVTAQGRAVDERGNWEARHGWRLAEIARITADLDRHWAEATLRAVRQGEPLAFGIECLRGAWATFSAGVVALDKAVPFDRSDELDAAQACLARQRQSLHRAEVALAGATSAVDAAQGRHWGRRDKPALRAATYGLARATQGVDAAREEVSKATQRLAAARTAEDERHAVIAASAPERARLVAGARDLDHAMALSRPGRVAAMASGREVPEHLSQALGPLSPTRGGQRVWCGLATEIEAERDGVRPAATGTYGLGAEDVSPWASASASWSAGRAYESPLGLIHAGSLMDPAPADAVVVEEPDAWSNQLRLARSEHIDRTREPRDLGLELDVGL